MPNSITLAKGFSTVLDEIYQAESKTSVLSSDQGLARQGANAKEIMVPKVSVDGLGDYGRNTGYTQGSVTFAWETKTFEYDRGTKILVDAMDVDETAGADAFVSACSELERTQVVPEGDAYTFAKICAKQGIGKVAAGVTYSTAADVLDAINDAMAAMDEAEVAAETRYLFITPTLKRMIDACNEYQAAVSKDVLDSFAQVIEVPQARFYTAIDLKAGNATDGFGYAKSTSQTAPGKDINFLIVEKSAVIKFDKHVNSRVFNPDELEDFDAYMMKYRKYGIVDVFDNKVAGIFLSHKA